MKERKELELHNLFRESVVRHHGSISERSINFISEEDLLAWRQELVSWINKQ